MATENEFPTIADLRDCLSELIEQGFGDQPVQVLVVPDSTLQAIAASIPGGDAKPALMIDLTTDTGRLPVGLISMRAIGQGGMETIMRQ